ncbi:MAG TPA: ScyD/ScyE family protein [Lapillicoccus sp.]|jgi:hypothetical protein|nr:ScyD/ScyE family protein [Lapillicoccus sp.]
MRPRSMLAALAAAGLAAGMAATPAQAADPLIQGLAGPLAISVDHGKIYVAQSFGGMLSRYGTDGSGGKILYQRKPKVEIGAVQAAGPGTLFAVTGKNADGKFAKLKHRASDGTVTTRADLRGFEKRFNPDGHVTYGFRDISASCAKKVPEEVGGASYKGIVDSHPYATAMMADGTAVVADAAGNDIITVSPSGFRTEIATLPGQPLRVSKAIASQFGMPGCAVGHKFWFEPVPTDVEVHGGMLYVSVLPGGPEDPSLGARGRVYTVDPDTGRATLLGKGFAGATDLAVSPKGKVYVTELFGGRVSTIKDGMAKKAFAAEQPAAIEWYKGKLYVAGGLEGPGYVRKVTP